MAWRRGGFLAVAPPMGRGKRAGEWSNRQVGNPELVTPGQKLNVEGTKCQVQCYCASSPSELSVCELMFVPPGRMARSKGIVVRGGVKIVKSVSCRRKCPH